MAGLRDAAAWDDAGLVRVWTMRHCGRRAGPSASSSAFSASRGVRALLAGDSRMIGGKNAGNWEKRTRRRLKLGSYPGAAPYTVRGTYAGGLFIDRRRSSIAARAERGLARWASIFLPKLPVAGGYLQSL